MQEKVKKIFSVDRYYKMNNAELEVEAHKWNIKGYGWTDGTIDRQIIINALLGKDKANDSRFAIFISAVALIMSILVLIFK